MRIGIIGCGNIGSALARHWIEAGHSLILSAKHQENAKRLAKQLGRQAFVGSALDAATQGEVVLLTVPLGQVPNLGNEVREALRGKIVMDTCNPYPERDGHYAEEVLKSGRGTGVWTASQIPGARVVRAFNSVYAEMFETQAHRKGQPVGVPLASDDEEGLKTVAALVRDAGFGPIIVGKLENGKLFDPGTPTYGSGLSDQELAAKLKNTAAAA